MRQHITILYKIQKNVKEKHLNFQLTFFLIYFEFPRPFIKPNYEYFYEWKYFKNDKFKYFLLWFSFCFVLFCGEEIQSEVKENILDLR